MQSMRRRVTSAIAVATLALLGSCSGGSDPEVSIQVLADRALAGEEAVERVEVSESPEEGSVDVAVVMAAEATVTQVADVADEARAFAKKNRDRAPSRWTSQVFVGDVGSPRIQVEVSPTVHESARADVRSAYSLAAVEGVTRVAYAGGTPYLEVRDVATVAITVRELRSSPLWDEGGSIHAGDERLRMMDEPRRVTLAQLEAIARAADRYPDASFALEAAATGDRYPAVYIDRVTSREANAIRRAFTGASLKSDNPEGYTLDFTMRAAGSADPNATIDSVDTFGVRD